VSGTTVHLIGVCFCSTSISTYVRIYVLIYEINSSNVYDIVYMNVLPTYSFELQRQSPNRHYFQPMVG
jgi:hypothetical protein